MSTQPISLSSLGNAPTSTTPADSTSQSPNQPLSLSALTAPSDTGMTPPGASVPPEQAEIPGTTGFENTSATTSSGRGLPTANKKDVQEGLKREAAVGATVATLPFAPIISEAIGGAMGISAAGKAVASVLSGGSMGALQSIAEDIAHGENPISYHHLNKTAQQTVIGMVLGGLFHGVASAVPAVKDFVNTARQGASIAQPGAQAAVREGVAASEAALPAPETPGAPDITLPKPSDAVPHKGMTQDIHSVETDPTIRDAARLHPFPPEQVKIKTFPPAEVEPGEPPEKPTVKITGPRGSSIEMELDGKTARVKSIVNSGEKGDGQRLYDNAIQWSKESGYDTFEGDKVQTEDAKKAWTHIADRHNARMSDTGTSSIDLKPSRIVPEPPAVAPASGRLVEGHNAVVDPQLQNMENQAKAAYREMDKVAGFDVKAEKLQLSNDKYKLAQLGNTDPDIAARGRLIESINDSQDRISLAQTKMRAAGIDPDVPDNLHKSMKAGQDFRKVLVARTDAGTGDVNIKGLLQDAQRLRNNPKYGDRLEQFFGSKNAADKFMKALTDADAQGVRAVKTQQIAKWAARITGTGALGAIGYGAATHLFNHVTGAVETIQ